MLAIEGLSKRYMPARQPLRTLLRVASDQPVDALGDVSFDVQPGEIVGLIGPNGAGKTTLVKIVGTLLLPSAGRAVVDGLDVVKHREAAKKRLGLMLAEERGLYWRLSGRQNLELFGVLYGLPPRCARKRAAELLDMLSLSEADKLVFGYSTGMRARLNLGRALAADPPLLLLDEPTRSLDPVARAEVATLMRRLADEGRAVLLASHDLDEVVTVCDRVVVLVGGTVRFVGDPTDLVGSGQAVTRSLVDFLVSELQQS
jgi:ABC-2 type transport system ATP-binding protein